MTGNWWNPSWIFLSLVKCFFRYLYALYMVEIQKSGLFTDWALFLGDARGTAGSALGTGETEWTPDSYDYTAFCVGHPDKSPQDHWRSPGAFHPQNSGCEMHPKTKLVFLFCSASLFDTLVFQYHDFHTLVLKKENIVCPFVTLVCRMIGKKPIMKLGSGGGTLQVQEWQRLSQFVRRSVLQFHEYPLQDMYWLLLRLIVSNPFIHWTTGPKVRPKTQSALTKSKWSLTDCFPKDCKMHSCAYYGHVLTCILQHQQHARIIRHTWELAKTLKSSEELGDHWFRVRLLSWRRICQKRICLHFSIVQACLWVQVLIFQELSRAAPHVLHLFKRPRHIQAAQVCGFTLLLCTWSLCAIFPKAGMEHLLAQLSLKIW